ncbi:MAG: hypothetical protein AAGF11_26400 [Myxococcota bacterium]
MRPSQRAAEVLAHPRWPWVAAVLGVLLASTALGSGLVLDDHLHRFVVQEHLAGGGSGAWWDLYVAAEGDEALTRARMNHGFAPWWTAPDLRVRFFRPLSAATHYLDYVLWPDVPALMHAHSLAWYAALVLAVGAVMRRWLGPCWVAGLATLVFAVDDAHGTPVGWIAQRNALIGATLVVCTLWVHDRARRDDWRPGVWLGPALWGLALLAGEASVAGLGYLLAHALLLEPGDEPWRRRTARGLGALWPYLLVMLLWRVLYDALGYGAEGSGVYLDPVREPGVFWAALPERAVALLLAQLGGPPAETWSEESVLGGMRWWWWVALSGLGLVLAFGLRRDRGLGVCLLGGLLALVPATTAVPGDRLLLLVGVGGSAIVAGVVAVAAGAGAASSGEPRWSRGFAVLLSIPLVGWHLGRAAWLLPGRVASLDERIERPQREAVRSLPDDPALTTQELVIVNSPPTFVSSTLWLWRWGSEHALPRRLRVLGSTFGPVVVQRPDAHTLVLQPVGGYLSDPFTTIARGRGRPLAVGNAVALDGWRVGIAGVAQGRPTVVRIAFDEPLDDPLFRWVTWRGGRFEPFVLPPIGGVVAIPGS